jgi:hypothetical protein
LPGWCASPADVPDVYLGHYVTKKVGIDEPPDMVGGAACLALVQVPSLALGADVQIGVDHLVGTMANPFLNDYARCVILYENGDAAMPERMHATLREA